MQGSVAVIVPTYNRAYLISQAVESLISQTRKPSQIVVVDDGSTDNTREVVQRYGPLVEYVYQANEGKPALRRTGWVRVGVGADGTLLLWPRGEGCGGPRVGRMEVSDA